MRIAKKSPVYYHFATPLLILMGVWKTMISCSIFSKFIDPHLIACVLFVHTEEGVVLYLQRLNPIGINAVIEFIVP